MSEEKNTVALEAYFNSGAYPDKYARGLTKLEAFAMHIAAGLYANPNVSIKREVLVKSDTGRLDYPSKLKAPVAVFDGEDIKTIAIREAKATLEALEKAIAEEQKQPLSYEERTAYACKVCGNVPDQDGMIEHGRGCYTQDENGGGTSFVEFSEKAK